LREELPGFFYYRTQLIEPIFHSLYYLQLQIYNILLERIEPLSRTGYYNLTMDVLNGYESRKPEIAPTIESVELITKRSVTASKNQLHLSQCHWQYRMMSDECIVL